MNHNRYKIVDTRNHRIILLTDCENVIKMWIDMIGLKIHSGWRKYVESLDSAKDIDLKMIQIAKDKQAEYDHIVTVINHYKFNPNPTGAGEIEYPAPFQSEHCFYRLTIERIT